VSTAFRWVREDTGKKEFNHLKFGMGQGQLVLLLRNTRPSDLKFERKGRRTKTRSSTVIICGEKNRVYSNVEDFNHHMNDISRGEARKEVVM